jgi:hypothetical protein
MRMRNRYDVVDDYVAPDREFANAGKLPANFGPGPCDLTAREFLSFKRRGVCVDRTEKLDQVRALRRVGNEVRPVRLVITILRAV